MTKTSSIFGKTAGSFQTDLSSVSLVIFGWFLGLTSSRLKGVSNGTLGEIFGLVEVAFSIFLSEGSVLPFLPENSPSFQNILNFGKSLSH